MPNLPERTCRGYKSGCKNTTSDSSGFCPACKPADWRGRNRQTTAHSRGYDRTWNSLSRRVAMEEPFCRACLAKGRHVPGAETDHIRPLDQHPELRLDRANLQRLCIDCHRKKTRLEHPETWPT